MEDGPAYRWTKPHDLNRFVDLPQRTCQPLEAALAHTEELANRYMEAEGWRVIDARAVLRDIVPYRNYVLDSLGELSFAPDQDVECRTGWFGDRSACFLAAGRPVIAQNTGFADYLPNSAGLFGFTEPDEAAGALEAVSADFRRHSRAAREIARECFDSGPVLTQLLEAAGVR
jgi:hypothetical protein